MNVTEGRFRNRQLHIEDYLQMVSAEQKEYTEVFEYSKTTDVFAMCITLLFFFIIPRSIGFVPDASDRFYVCGNIPLDKCIVLYGNL